jgi:hypothetical protein
MAQAGADGPVVAGPFSTASTVACARLIDGLERHAPHMSDRYRTCECRRPAGSIG